MTRRLVDHCRSINMGRPPKLKLDPDRLRWWPKNRPILNKESKVVAIHC